MSTNRTNNESDLSKENYEKLTKIYEKFHDIDTSKDYYKFTLTADQNGRPMISTHTHLVGWLEQDNMPKLELREPSIIKPDFFINYWQENREKWMEVHDEVGYIIFNILGGNALIEKEFILRHDPKLLAPAPCALSGVFQHLKSLHEISKAELQRAPTPKQRMRILKRDSCRCRICGESPSDNVHIKLILHHIRLWSEGGLTEDDNLITICGTCHEGLLPHRDYSLFNLIDMPNEGCDIERARSEHNLGVERYREYVKRTFKQHGNKSKKKQSIQSQKN